MRIHAYVASAVLAFAMTASAFAADPAGSRPAKKPVNKKAQAEAMFVVLDVYKDGKIVEAIWIKSGRSSADFKRADKNKDGIVDKQEFLLVQ